MQQNSNNAQSKKMNMASMVGGRISLALRDALDNFTHVGRRELGKAYASIAEHGGAAWSNLSRRTAVTGKGSRVFNAAVLGHMHHSHLPKAQNNNRAPALTAA